MITRLKAPAAASTACAALLAGALAACSGPGPGPTDPAHPPPHTIANETPKVPGVFAITGSWTSPSCGARTYAREISFSEKGDFHARDLVSPCPAGMHCVWSGIVDADGTYAVSGDKIILKPSKPPSGKGQPLPATMTIAPGTKAPAEEADGKLCQYVHAPPSADKKP